MNYSLTRIFIEYDLWGNITTLINGDIIIKRGFNEEELIWYEDYDGNYWDISFGIDNPFSKILASRISVWDGYSSIESYFTDSGDITLYTSNFFYSTGYTHIRDFTITYELEPVFSLVTDPSRLELSGREYTNYDNRSWCRKIKD